MYISLKWIKEIIGIQKLTLNEFVERLTLAGFEIESITKKKDFESTDLILDISFTANRADVSIIKGLITEIITLFNSQIFFEIPNHIKPLILLNNQASLDVFNLDSSLYSQTKKNFLRTVLYKSVHNYKAWQSKYLLWEWYLQKKSFTKTITDVNVLNSNECILYTAISKKVKVKSSPYWIKNRLLLMGFTPVNNIVDTINYVMLETGQVFFAYDHEILEDFMATKDLVFITKPAPKNSLFPISESKTIKLDQNISTLTINDKIISIPGLIQNYKTLINNATSYFVLQYGIFDSKKIKIFSKLLNLRTEYSIKSEKQTDLNLIEQAYLRLIHIFWTQNIKFDDKGSERITFKSQKNNPILFYNYIKHSEKQIKVFYKNIKTLTGPYNRISSLNDFQIVRNLKLLNFKITFQTDKNFHVLVPLARKVDIEREVDIVEEIVRVIGFNKFKPLIINNTKFGDLTKFEKLKRRLRSYLLNLGFNESIHSILIKKSRTDEIRLKNPLFNESSVLRSSLLDGLIDKVDLNQKNIGKMFETFELGRVYNLLSDGKKKEIEVMSGVFGGQIFHSPWSSKNSALNWFEAKGILETLMEKLNLSLSIYWNPTNNCGTKFHPNLTTNLLIGNQKLGIFGQIHPILALKKNLSKKVYLFEINTEILNRFSESKTLIKYIPYSSYPISYIDLSFIINKSILSSEIKEIIFILGQPLLKSISLFDYYSGQPIKEGYCSLTFKLKFQSETRTLSNDEVIKITTPIIQYLEKHYDIKFQE